MKLIKINIGVEVGMEPFLNQIFKFIERTVDFALD